MVECFDDFGVVDWCDGFGMFVGYVWVLFLILLMVMVVSVGGVGGLSMLVRFMLCRVLFSM